jgi:LuxR family maltose regulon positive regulatory protein
MELRKLEPDLVNELRSRAAHWYEAEGHHDVALDLAQAADDADHAARLFKHVAIRAFRDGRLASAMRWLAWFDEHNYLHEYPLVALAGAWLRTLTGEAEGALALSTYADGQLGDELLADEITTATAWAAQLRALWCRDGVETMRRDAESAFDMTPEASSQRAPALLFCGMAKLLQGDDEAADADFVETIEIGSRTGSSHAVVIGFAERAGISIKRGDWKIADELSQQALSCIGEHHLEEYPTSALAYVMAAHATFHQRGDEAARDSLIRAQRLRVQLTYSVPWLAVQTRLESARTYLAMADPAGARAVVREAEMIFRRCPDLGVLRTQLEELKRLARDAPTAAPGISTLTSAELRLLPLLATHLTFPEMGDRLFVSRHTVKSQAISIYRKLEVSSRSEAVQQAGDLGLLER